MNEENTQVGNPKTILVVGAGFAGATVARELAEAGHAVVVIDKRDHIAGNAYDYIDEETGIRVHKYGPHIWHTSNDLVQEYISRFTEWVPYKHRVKALWNERLVPLPINAETIEKVFGEEFRYSEMTHADFLDSKRVKSDEPVTNSRQHVERSVGKRLCDIFFAPYTKKMWDLDLEDLPTNVAARIPTKDTYDDLYFPNDKHQFMPKDGYTSLISNMLDHPRIAVLLGCCRQDMTAEFDEIFTAEPIDEFFNCEFGELPWRSVRMHVNRVAKHDHEDWPSDVATINFTDTSRFTRMTDWSHFPNSPQHSDLTITTTEEPCDYRDNSYERYYPVKTSHADCPYKAILKKYQEKAEEEGIHFIGRCGQFLYLDMHQAIANSLQIVRKYLKENS